MDLGAQQPGEHSEPMVNSMPSRTRPTLVPATASCDDDQPTQRTKGEVSGYSGMSLAPWSWAALSVSTLKRLNEEYLTLILQGYQQRYLVGPSRDRLNLSFPFLQAAFSILCKPWNHVP